MQDIKESGAGKLCESNGFLAPVVSGSEKEMGTRYAALMVDAMQRTWDMLVAPGRKSGSISDEDFHKRACTRSRSANRLPPRRRCTGAGSVSNRWNKPGWTSDMRMGPPGEFVRVGKTETE